ncbi:MAG TPA: DNA-3-methyladenine glycosylase I, partial [Motiliproteus sp.]
MSGFNPIGEVFMQDWQRREERVHSRSDWSDILARLPLVRTAEELLALGDDRYLSEICRRVFRAGLKHALVDAKWPAFEQAFFGFDPQRLVLMSDEQLEGQMQNKALIRHWGKLKAVRHNAIMVERLAENHGSFARLLAEWPSDDIVGLWALLKKEGAHLGGHSGPAFLRQVGKDTFR